MNEAEESTMVEASPETANVEAVPDMTLVEGSPLAKLNCVKDGRRCSGKKLSNRDAHNCKVKSHGKHYDCDHTKQCVKINEAVSRGMYNGGCYN